MSSNCHDGKTADGRARGIAWKLVIRILVADLIVFIPFLLSYTVFADYVPSGTHTQRNDVDGDRSVKGV